MGECFKMGKFARFMKSNKAQVKNGFYAPTKSLTDEDGKPLKWELKHITSKENEALRDSCMAEVPVTGKPGVYRPRLQVGKYIKKLMAASVVFPDLYDSELQDSYGVSTPEDLLMELVDNPGEFADFSAYIQQFQGFDETIDDKVEEAKN